MELGGGGGGEGAGPISSVAYKGQFTVPQEVAMIFKLETFQSVNTNG